MENSIIVKFIAILCFSSFPFLFSLQGDFVFDDSEAILNNADISSESWTNMFYNDFWGTNIKANVSHKSYRPLTVMTFRLNYILNGKILSAIYFKVTNLICHILCSSVVWLTYKDILYNHQFKYEMNGWQTDIAFMSVLLFCVHPVHVEAVCGIVGRADILAAILFFIAFRSYNKAIVTQQNVSFYLVVTVALATAAMLFKESGITVLGFCLSYDLISYEKRRISKLSLQNLNKDKQIISVINFQCVARVIFLVISSVLLLYVRWTIMGGSVPQFKPTDNPAAFSNKNSTKILTYSYIYFLNLVLLVWPQWLCFDWSMGCVPLIDDFMDYRVIPVALMYLFGMILIWKILWSRKTSLNKRVIPVAIMLIIIPFLPATNIFYSVGFVIAERVLYISSAGYCLMITIGLHKIMSLQKRKFNKIAVSLYILLLVVYALRSWERSHDWQNEYRLFTSGLRVCPLNAKVHYNVAKMADANNQTDWAIYEYEESIRLHPEYYQAMNNLGNLLKNLNQHHEAEFYLRSAITHKRDFPAAWMNLGIVLAVTKRYDQAERAYKTALMYRNKYPDCYYNLGNLYLEQNKSDAAVTSWLEAINLNSKHVLAWTNLLALLDNTGQLTSALELIPKALSEVPQSPSVNFAIANIYGKLDRFAEAETHFLDAIRLFGTRVHAIHYANLGVLYHRWNKYTLAEEMYKKSLAKDPTFQSAQRNLKSLEKLKRNSLI